MEFAWDPTKSDANLRSRGFDFAYASRVFRGPIVTFEDSRRNYGERRMMALGMVDDEALAVVYTDRGDVRRIISARPASRKERLRLERGE